jgi:cytochrome P450
MAIKVYQGKGYWQNGQAFFSDTLEFVLKRQAELGSFYRLPLPFRRLYICSDPSIIQEVLVTKQKHFRKSIAYREMRIALGNGLLTSEGDFWLRQRRLIQPAFHRTALEKLYLTMQSVTASWLDRLAEEIKVEPIVDMANWMTHLTAEIALKTLFSSDKNQDNPDAARQIADAQAYVLWRVSRPWLKPIFPLLPRHWKFKRDMGLFDASVYAMIKERRETALTHHDLLDLLLHAKDEETGAFMADDQIRDEVLTLYVAGHDTSSNALSWACHCLANNPDSLDRLLTEVSYAFPDATPTYTELQQLTFTKMVTDEILRLYPPAHGIGREVAQPVAIADEVLESGSVIFMSLFALHRNPDFWDNPGQFNPDRFSSDHSSNRPKYAYLPFGAGPRMCIGMQFALQEIPLILASFVRRFHMEPVPGETTNPEALLTLKPMPGVRVRLSLREPK